MEKRRALVILTARKEILFGYTQDPIDARDMTLSGARMAVHFEAAVRGALGLAVGGPTAGCRISQPVTKIFVREVDWACECSEAAIAAWEVGPWR